MWSQKVTSRSECVETLDEKKEEEEIDPNSIRLSLDNFKYVFLLFFMAFLISFVVFLYEMITKSQWIQIFFKMAHKNCNSLVCKLSYM